MIAGRNFGTEGMSPIGLLWTISFLVSTVLFISVEQYVARRLTIGGHHIDATRRDTRLVVATVVGGVTADVAFAIVTIDMFLDGSSVYVLVMIGILSSTVVMAPYDGRIVISLPPRAMKGESLTIFGEGNQTRSFCYVDDLVEGLRLLAESTVTDSVNLGIPIEMSVNDFVDIIVELLGDTGREHREFPGSDPVRRRPDITRATTLLGWVPTTSLDDGLRRTLAYLTALDR